MTLAAVALLSVFFTSCPKDDKEPDGYAVTAEDVEGGSSSIKTVKAILDGDDLAEGAYKNDGFTVTLPVPKSSYYEEILDGVGVEGCMLDGFYAYDDDDDEIGEFLHAKLSDDGDTFTMAFYIYVDEDLEIDESDEYFDIYISAKKGWTILYVISDDEDLEEGTFTTKKQSDLRWIYSSNSTRAGNASSMRAAAAEKIKNLLKQY
jgi:hypothetical protein